MYICYGFGKYGRECVSALVAQNESIKAILDKNRGMDAYYQNIPIVDPEELHSLLEINDIIVLTSINYISEIFLNLCHQNIKQKIRFYDVERGCVTDIGLGFERSYSRRNYSQFGEQFYLERVFANRNEGFYVDVGAHHPFRFSNTYWAYLKGWHGINIDPNSEAIELFDVFRKRDYNLKSRADYI